MNDLIGRNNVWLYPLISIMVVLVYPHSICLATEAQSDAYDTTTLTPATLAQLTEQIDQLNQIASTKFRKLEFIDSRRFAQEALTLAEQTSYAKGKAIALLHLAKVLVECGLPAQAMPYIQRAQAEPYFAEDILCQAEIHRLRGKVYANQKLYTLAKTEFFKQLNVSQSIEDTEKRNLSILWSYQNIEHLYAIQSMHDSTELYQELQEMQLSQFTEADAYYGISTLQVSKGRLYMLTGRYEEAEVELKRSLALLDKYKSPYRYYTLQALGDLFATQKYGEQAVAYYKEALHNAELLNVKNTVSQLYGKLADCMFEFQLTLDEARYYEKEYTLLTDSLNKQNEGLTQHILQEMLAAKDESARLDTLFLAKIVCGVLILSLGLYLWFYFSGLKSQKRLKSKEKRFIATQERIEVLKEQVDRSQFNEMVKMAKSNSPDFLPLFSKEYPEFVEEMKRLDASIQPSELYFLALNFFNFSTKDIAEYTSVSIRAVQVRKNRLRKKYHIESDVDFTQWVRERIDHHI